MSKKSDFYTIFVHFKQSVEKLFGHSIKILRSDGGGEYSSIALATFLQHNGLHQFSCPHTPEQNGVVECKHQHVLSLSRALMHQSGVPPIFWPQIFQTSVFLINKLPSSSIAYKTPHELLFQKPPDYSFLKIFGCACYPWLQPYTKSKLDARSTQCIFLGYSQQHKGYNCFDPVTKRFFVSRYVIFDENLFPFRTSSLLSTDIFSPIVPIFSTATSFSTVNKDNIAVVPHTAPTTDLLQSVSSVLLAPSSGSPFSAGCPTNNDHSMVTRAKLGIFKPKVLTVSSSFSTDNSILPTTFNQAILILEWKNAMLAECNALLATNTWQLVPPHPGQNPVGCKWVFKLKHNPDGSIESYKARLVAKGYHQQQGLDYTETFSPVAKRTTIRTVLTIAVQNSWSTLQLDVSNAFLHGKLNETVFMTQPPGFKDSHNPNYVCKLIRSLYGLKQAPRTWYNAIHEYILSIGFTISMADPSLFICKDSKSITYMLIYVDDILLTGSSTLVCHDILQSLQTQFAVKNFGPIHYFLGIEFHKISSGFFLHQSRYVSELLSKAGMDSANPCQTHCTVGQYLTAYGTPITSDQASQYRSLVGSLQYLSWTRPDISFSINQVCQYLHNPMKHHLQALKCILCFLKRTSSYGIHIKKSSSLLTAYSDADWVGSNDDRRSTSGYSIFLGSNLFSWSAKKQPTVARSSTEAEYRALAVASAEITWLCKLFCDLHV